MLVVDHVVALGQVPILLGRLRASPSRLAVGAPTAGDLLLTQYSHSQSRHDETLMDPDGHDGRTQMSQSVATVEGQSCLGEGVGDTIGRRFTVHRHHRRDAPCDQPIDPSSDGFGIAGSCIETGGAQHLIGRASGGRGHLEMRPRPDRVFEVDEQRRVVAGFGGGFPPGGSEGGGELGLFLDQVATAIQSSHRVDHDQAGPLREIVDETSIVRQPRKPRLDARE